MSSWQNPPDVQQVRALELREWLPPVQLDEALIVGARPCHVPLELPWQAARLPQALSTMYSLMCLDHVAGYSLPV